MLFKNTNWLWKTESKLIKISAKAVIPSGNVNTESKNKPTIKSIKLLTLALNTVPKAKTTSKGNSITILSNKKDPLKDIFKDNTSKKAIDKKMYAFIVLVTINWAFVYFFFLLTIIISVVSSMLENKLTFHVWSSNISFPIGTLLSKTSPMPDV